jgi:hypothetical protein
MAAYPGPVEPAKLAYDRTTRRKNAAAMDFPKGLETGEWRDCSVLLQAGQVRLARHPVTAIMERHSSNKPSGNLIDPPCGGNFS